MIFCLFYRVKIFCLPSRERDSRREQVFTGLLWRETQQGGNHGDDGRGIRAKNPRNLRGHRGEAANSYPLISKGVCH